MALFTVVPHDELNSYVGCGILQDSLVYTRIIGGYNVDPTGNETILCKTYNWHLGESKENSKVLLNNSNDSCKIIGKDGQAARMLYISPEKNPAHESSSTMQKLKGARSLLKVIDLFEFDTIGFLRIFSENHRLKEDSYAYGALQAFNALIAYDDSMLSEKNIDQFRSKINMGTTISGSGFVLPLNERLQYIAELQEEENELLK